MYSLLPMRLLPFLVLGLALALVFLGPVALPGHAADNTAPRFLSSLEDVPLMPGLEEEAAQAVVFDTPEGRLVESAARGHVDPDSVARFYNEALPELGWRTEGGLRFSREGEMMEIVVRPDAGAVVVLFAVSPVGGD